MGTRWRAALRRSRRSARRVASSTSASTSVDVLHASLPGFVGFNGAITESFDVGRGFFDFAESWIESSYESNEFYHGQVADDQRLGFRMA